jgi:hypothetical protein
MEQDHRWSFAADNRMNLDCSGAHHLVVKPVGSTDAFCCSCCEIGGGRVQFDEKLAVWENGYGDLITTANAAGQSSSGA